MRMVLFRMRIPQINGIQNVGGHFTYYIDGIKAPAGMIQIDNDIYYVNSKA